MSTWRVEYGLWAAGGKIIHTHVEVAADTPSQAVNEAIALQNRRDELAGRANRGYFNEAVARLIQDGGS